MSQDQEEPAANPDPKPRWQQVPRSWVYHGTHGYVPNGQGQDTDQLPLDRWLNEGQSDAPYDNVGAVVSATTTDGGAVGMGGK